MNTKSGGPKLAESPVHNCGPPVRISPTPDKELKKLNKLHKMHSSQQNDYKIYNEPQPITTTHVLI